MWWKNRWGARGLAQTDREKLEMLLSLVNSNSQPNLNALMRVARNVEPMSLSIKQFGYSLARQLAAALPPPGPTEARHVGLGSKVSTQADIESDWVAHWCAQMGAAVVYHRKVWELCYALQAVYENGCLREGARALGFGCGQEVLPSYFAAHGIAITATDLPAEEAQAAGWAATHQHAAHLDQAFHPHLVTRETFDRLVSLRFVDMNAIPKDLTGYDFCWSICALEHLGSIRKGLEFIENSIATLKPGGIAVHTTELNINASGQTIDNWPTVLFQRHHFEELAARLTAQGHMVAPLDFSLGDRPMDRFVDLPPWEHDLSPDMNAWLGQPAHLKLSVDGFVSTCFGIVVKRAE